MRMNLDVPEIIESDPLKILDKSDSYYRQASTYVGRLETEMTTRLTKKGLRQIANEMKNMTHGNTIYEDKKGEYVYVKSVLTPEAKEVELGIEGPEPIVIDVFEYLMDRCNLKNNHFKNSEEAKA